MRTPLIAGNWKMNGTCDSARELARGIVQQAPTDARCEWAVCPPFVHLHVVAEQLKGSPIQLGAQNCCDKDQGAATGEVAGDMLTDMGCRYAIVGHSERRELYAEDDQLIARRFVAAQRHGLVPILCVGETLSQRNAGEVETVLRHQLEAVFQAAGEGGLANSVIAYEPVWAIGTGETATPEQAQEMHAFIRGLVRERDAATADKLRILYGGSMKAKNAADLLACDDVDGGLIGGASLDAEGFAAIGAATRA